MSVAESWSAAEIEVLKCGFLERTSFKVLSQRLGRSPSAVNKALARFHIRPERPKTPKADLKLDFSPKQSRPDVLSAQGLLRAERSTRPHVCPRSRPVWPPRKKDGPIPIFLDQLVAYLRRHGYPIEEHSHILGNKRTPFFTLNQRPLTPVQLLVKANTIRLDAKLPIFILQNLVGE